MMSTGTAYYRSVYQRPAGYSNDDNFDSSIGLDDSIDDGNINGNNYISSHNTSFVDPGHVNNVSGYDDLLTDRTRNSNDAGVTDWNSQFQAILERIPSTVTPSTIIQPENDEDGDLLSVYKDLSVLMHNFSYVAKLFGKIIICERHLPNELKTIRPVDLGGIAGGVKFIAGGILFKFSVDIYGLYGSDEAAAKASGHELKGVMQFFQAEVKCLKVPLLCCVDYKGHRLLAQSILPIDKLVYGSDDGGKHVYASMDEFNERMSEVARHLNLKPHITGIGGADKVEIPFPTDIEGHVGTDGRHYVLDFGRLQPPEDTSLRPTPIFAVPGAYRDGPTVTSRAVRRNEHLYKRLRPELVTRNCVPLSSDAFSQFGRESKVEHNREVTEATVRLRDEVVPMCAAYLDGHEPHQARGINITTEVHKRGINMRYLGLLRKHVKQDHISNMLLMEMVARVCKATLRQKMRECMSATRLPLEEPFKEEVVLFLNHVLNVDGTYWTHDIIHELTEKFEGALDVDVHSRRLSTSKNGESESLPHLLRDKLNRVGGLHALLARIQKSLGIELSTEAMDQLRHSPSSSFSLVTSDICKMEPTVKYMHLVAHAEAMSLSIESMRRTPAHGDRIFQLAVTKFQTALSCNPGNDATVKAYADALLLQSTRKTGSARTKLILQALERYRTVRHGRVLVWLGKRLQQVGMAEGNSEDRFALLELAAKSFESAESLDAAEYHAWGDILCTLSRMKVGLPANRLWAQAGEKYEQFILNEDSAVAASVLPTLSRFMHSMPREDLLTGCISSQGESGWIESSSPSSSSTSCSSSSSTSSSSSSSSSSSCSSSAPSSSPSSSTYPVATSSPTPLALPATPSTVVQMKVSNPLTDSYDSTSLSSSCPTHCDHLYVPQYHAWYVSLATLVQLGQAQCGQNTPRATVDGGGASIPAPAMSTNVETAQWETIDCATVSRHINRTTLRLLSRMLGGGVVRSLILSGCRHVSDDYFVSKPCSVQPGEPRIVPVNATADGTKRWIRFDNLESLDLGGTRVTGNVLPRLFATFPRLYSVKLSGCAEIQHAELMIPISSSTTHVGPKKCAVPKSLVTRKKKGSRSKTFPRTSAATSAPPRSILSSNDRRISISPPKRSPRRRGPLKASSLSTRRVLSTSPLSPSRSLPLISQSEPSVPSSPSSPPPAAGAAAAASASSASLSQLLTLSSPSRRPGDCTTTTSASKQTRQPLTSVDLDSSSSARRALSLLRSLPLPSEIDHGDENSVVVANKNAAAVSDDAGQQLRTTHDDKRGTRLTSLNLSKCCRLSSKALYAYLDFTGRTLRTLNLSSCTMLSTAALTQIAHRCDSLRELDLNHCNKAVTDQVMMDIAANCPSLVSLSLRGCTRLTRQSYRHIFLMSKLRSLYTSVCAELPEVYVIDFIQCQGAGVTHLDLSGAKLLTDKVLFSLAQFAADLEYLGLDDCKKITDTGVSSLAHACPKLRYLSVASLYKITDESISDVSQACPSLSTLCISGCERVTDASFIALGNHASELKVVEASNLTRVSSVGFSALSTGCPNITKLHLRGCQVGEGGLRTIAERLGPSLESLCVGRCKRITSSSLLELASVCANLRHLDLQENKEAVADSVVVAFARHCPKMTRLLLTQCTKITDEAIFAVGALCPTLRMISVSGCYRLSDEGIKYLASGCPQLTTVRLSFCRKLSDASIIRLASCCRQLRELRLNGVKQLSDTAVGHLTESSLRMARLSVDSSDKIKKSSLRGLRARGVVVTDHA